VSWNIYISAARLVVNSVSLTTEPGVQVAKIIDRPLGYGVALSCDLTAVDEECRKFLQVNAKSIDRLVDKSTKKLTVSCFQYAFPRLYIIILLL